MKHLRLFFKRNRDTALLSGAVILLALAILHPTIPIKHNIYTYLLVADISQSMNAVDVPDGTQTISRIAQTQKIMHEVVSSLPCNTKVSIGLFAGASIAALYQPIEVCENFHAIQDTIDHLDWRTAWSGNSRIRESLYSAARAIRGFPEPANWSFLLTVKKRLGYTLSIPATSLVFKAQTAGFLSGLVAKKASPFLS